MNSFDQEIKKIAEEVATLVVKKQADYGTTTITDNVYGPWTVLGVEIGIKLARAKSLAEQGKDPNYESFEDCWRDIAGYALIGMMISRGVFDKPLESEENT